MLFGMRKVSLSVLVAMMALGGFALDYVSDGLVICYDALENGADQTVLKNLGSAGAAFDLTPTDTTKDKFTESGLIRTESAWTMASVAASEDIPTGTGYTVEFVGEMTGSSGMAYGSCYFAVSTDRNEGTTENSGKTVFTMGFNAFNQTTVYGSGTCNKYSDNKVNFKSTACGLRHPTRTLTINRASGTIRWYEDGTYMGSATSGGVNNGIGRMTLGDLRKGCGSYWQGNIASVRVYTRVLTADEMATNRALDASRFPKTMWTYGARTFCVDASSSAAEPDGSVAKPYPTIAAAQADARLTHGDEIRIAAGMYAEAVVNTTVHYLALSGGWSHDFSACDPHANVTVINPGNSANSCVTFGAIHGGSLRGLTLTGGADGYHQNMMPTGGINVGDGEARKYLHVTLDSCICTNNVGHGAYVEGDGSRSYGIALKSSLLAANGGSGFYSKSDHGGFHYLYNCTLANNVGAGLYCNYGYMTYFVKNCLIAGNRSRGISMYYNKSGDASTVQLSSTFIGDNTLSGSPADISEYFDRETIVFGPGSWVLPVSLGSDYRLQAGSPAIGRGSDLSADAVEPVTTDLTGQAFAAPWTPGCYASDETPAVRPNYADVYVATDGDDTRTGETPATAVASWWRALWQLADGGTVHLGSGVFAFPCVWLRTDAMTLAGAGPTATFLSGAGSSGGSVVRTGAPGTTLRDLTVCDSPTTPGFQTMGYSTARHATLVNVAITNCLYGVYRAKTSSNDSQCYDYCRLDKCRIVGNLSWGLYLIQDAPWEPFYASNCLIADNVSGGVHDGSNRSKGGRYHNCTIVDNGGYGLWIQHEAHGLYVRNCIIADNETYDVAAAAKGDTLKTYLIRCNFGASPKFSDANSRLSFTETVEGDPLFVSRHGEDYYLGEQSPCLLAGMDLSTDADCPVVGDLVGTRRLPKKGYDLGCLTTLPPGLMLLVR